MKRPYSSPLLFTETYTLDTSITASCNMKAHTGNPPISCMYGMNGYEHPGKGCKPHWPFG